MSDAQTTLAHMALATCSLLFWTSASAAQQPSARQQELGRWQLSVTRHFFPFVTHPDLHLAECGARREGFVIVEFTIDRAGRVLSAHVAKTSGMRAIDRTAADIVKRASPVPAPPLFVQGTAFKLRLPVTFKSSCHSANP